MIRVIALVFLLWAAAIGAADAGIVFQDDFSTYNNSVWVNPATYWSSRYRGIPGVASAVTVDGRTALHIQSVFVAADTKSTGLAIAQAQQPLVTPGCRITVDFKVGTATLNHVVFATNQNSNPGYGEQKYVPASATPVQLFYTGVTGGSSVNATGLQANIWYRQVVEYGTSITKYWLLDAAGNLITYKTFAFGASAFAGSNNLGFVLAQKNATNRSGTVEAWIDKVVIENPPPSADPGSVVAGLSPYDTPSCEVHFVDFNCDAVADNAEINLATGDLNVRYNDGQKFSTQPDITVSAVAPSPNDYKYQFADINGDQLPDLIKISRYFPLVYVYYKTTAGFNTAPDITYTRQTGHTGDGWRTLTGDVNGDSFGDLVDVDLTSGNAYVYLSTGDTIAATPTFTAAGIGKLAGQTDGWEPILADFNGDGYADFVKFCTDTNRFYFYTSIGNGFSTSNVRDFYGPREIFEHEYSLVDMNVDGRADVVQHNLRTGDTLVFIQKADADGLPYIGTFASELCFTTPYARCSGQRKLQDSGDQRSLNAIAWYDDDHWPDDWRPENGWWSMNPNHPNNAPNNSRIYRSGTSLLGAYDMKKWPVIKQHAYWLRAAGVDAIAVDWTNIVSARDPSNSSYGDNSRIALNQILACYSTITEFIPPKVYIVLRMPGEDNVRTTWVADDIYDIYNSYPSRLWFTYNDGTASKNKPFVVVFSDLGPAWAAGPQWTDTRFNCRYSNGYLMGRAFVTSENNDWGYFSNYLPYWNFVESSYHPTKGTGYYKNLYRRLSYNGTVIPEQAAVWCAKHLGGLNWDGQQDLIDGKTCLDRDADSMWTKYQRNVLLCRWNYPMGWYDYPGEGINWNGSTMIEPSEQSGFTIYDDATALVHNLKKLRTGVPPGKPVITSYSSGKYITFASSGYPTRVRFGLTPTGGTWDYYNVNELVKVPADIQGKSFYFTTANNWGSSETTYHAVPTTSASPGTGVYNAPLTVTLSASTPGRIYYTTDGSEPDTSSNLYTGPLTLSFDTVLQSFVVDYAGDNVSTFQEAVYWMVTQSDIIGEIKKLSNGTPIRLTDRVLFWKDGTTGYVEEPDRSSAIRIEIESLPALGSVCLSGILNKSGSDAHLAVDMITPGVTAISVKPLGASNAAIKKAAMNAMYVKAWGKVQPGSLTTDSFVINDGSDSTGIRVKTTTGQVTVQEGQYVTVTGAVDVSTGEAVVLLMTILVN